MAEQGSLWAGKNLPQRLKIEVTREHATGPDVVVLETYSFGTKSVGPLWVSGQKFEGAHAETIVGEAVHAEVLRWLGGGWRAAGRHLTQQEWEHHLFKF